MSQIGFLISFTKHPHKHLSCIKWHWQKQSTKVKKMGSQQCQSDASKLQYNSVLKIKGYLKHISRPTTANSDEKAIMSDFLEISYLGSIITRSGQSILGKSFWVKPHHVIFPLSVPYCQLIPP